MNKINPLSIIHILRYSLYSYIYKGGYILEGLFGGLNITIKIPD